MLNGRAQTPSAPREDHYPRLPGTFVAHAYDNEASTTASDQRLVETGAGLIRRRPSAEAGLTGGYPIRRSRADGPGGRQTPLMSLRRANLQLQVREHSIDISHNVNT